jgi:hypothetical protein
VRNRSTIDMKSAPYTGSPKGHKEVQRWPRLGYGTVEILADHIRVRSGHEQGTRAVQFDVGVAAMSRHLSLLLSGEKLQDRCSFGIGVDRLSRSSRQMGR